MYITLKNDASELQIDPKNTEFIEIYKLLLKHYKQYSITHSSDYIQLNKGSFHFQSLLLLDIRYMNIQGVRYTEIDINITGFEKIGTEVYIKDKNIKELLFITKLTDNNEVIIDNYIITFYEVGLDRIINRVKIKYNTEIQDKQGEIK